MIDIHVVDYIFPPDIYLPTDYARYLMQPRWLKIA